MNIQRISFWRATLLRHSLAAALATMASGAGAGSVDTFSATSLGPSGALLFQGVSSGRAGGGQLLARPVALDGSLGAPRWDAGALLAARAPGTRAIWTADPEAAAGARGLPFLWPSLRPAQRAALDRDSAGATDRRGDARLEYVRGSRDDESPQGAKFRARAGLLGDITGSQPLIAGTPDYGFSRLAGAEGASYAAFRASVAQRPGMVYVGANDAMLHAISAASGEEIFAYLPNDAIARLPRMTQADAPAGEPFLVDGSPRVLDAYLDGAWQTVVVCAAGAGGRSVFALRVTHPDSFAAADVLWEYSAAQDPDLGQSVPAATLARMANGKWAAIVANGYGSAGGVARLLIIDLASGALLRTLDTGAGPDNGLSSPVPVDLDGDHVVDAIYAGDLRGNLWKFDVSSASAAEWDVAFREGGVARPLFQACVSTTGDCADAAQPITARPEVGLNPRGGGVIVWFGTGRYFARGDQDRVAPVNSLYAIFDRNPPRTATPLTAGSGRANLQAQTVLPTPAGGGALRVTSAYPLAAAANGWYLDLPERGERVLAAPVLRADRVVFATIAPAGEPPGGGKRWLMIVDAATGARLAYSPFDTDGNGRFDRGDYAGQGADAVPASGRSLADGAAGVAMILAVDGDWIDEGGDAMTRANPRGISGRRSWRQLQ